MNQLKYVEKKPKQIRFALYFRFEVSFQRDLDMTIMYDSKVHGVIISHAALVDSTVQKTNCLIHRELFTTEWGYVYSFPKRRYIAQTTVLTIPAGYHSVILSFEYVDREPAEDHFAYYSFDTQNGSDLMNKTNLIEFPEDSGSSAATLIVNQSIKIVNCLHFQPKAPRHITKSFQLQFTFLKEEEVPVIVNEILGLYDCKGDNYKRFESHVRCNQIVQCSGWEDERGCVYHTQRIHQK